MISKVNQIKCTFYLKMTKWLLSFHKLGDPTCHRDHLRLNIEKFWHQGINHSWALLGKRNFLFALHLDSLYVFVAHVVEDRRVVENETKCWSGISWMHARILSDSLKPLRATAQVQQKDRKNAMTVWLDLLICTKLKNYAKKLTKTWISMFRSCSLFDHFSINRFLNTNKKFWNF